MFGRERKEVRLQLTMKEAKLNRHLCSFSPDFPISLSLSRSSSSLEGSSQSCYLAFPTFGLISDWLVLQSMICCVLSFLLLLHVSGWVMNSNSKIQFKLLPLTLQRTFTSVYEHSLSCVSTFLGAVKNLPMSPAKLAKVGDNGKKKTFGMQDSQLGTKKRSKKTEGRRSSGGKKAR